MSKTVGTCSRVPNRDMGSKSPKGDLCRTTYSLLGIFTTVGSQVSVDRGMLRRVESGDFPGEAFLPWFSCKRKLSQGQLACVSTISIMFSSLMALNQCPMGGLRGHSLSLSYLSPPLSSGSQLECHITVKFPCHRVRLAGSCPSSLDYCPSYHRRHSAIVFFLICVTCCLNTSSTETQVPLDRALLFFWPYYSQHLVT